MKKKILASLLFLMIFITSTIVYAAIDAKVEMNSSLSSVKPGDEVTFTIKVKDIVSENGANGIEGTISYDTDKFEELKAENVTKVGSWDVAYYNGKVIAEGLSAVNNDTDVISIKLKVKEDSSLVGKTATVSLNNTVVYNTEKVDLGTASASVKIEASSSNEGNDNNNENTEQTPTPTAKPNGGSESTPTPSTKPGGTNSTPAPGANNNQNSGSDKGDIPITNINTNTSSGSGSSNKGNTSSGTTSSGSSSSGSSSSSTIKGSTTSSSSLPKAGIGSAITVLTVVAAALGTVAYIKLRKYREI